MDRFDDCLALFQGAVERAKQMVSLFDALEMLRRDERNHDALRAAWIQAVSSFDFFVHELVAVEATYRYVNAVPTRNLVMPVEVAVIRDPVQRHSAYEAYVRKGNSYKSFVAPEKLAEVFSCFTTCPWEKISVVYKEINGLEEGAVQLKQSLKQIWDRRNKIAHEADINPAMSGTQLWPVYSDDALFTIDFVSRIGKCLPRVISSPDDFLSVAG